MREKVQNSEILFCNDSKEMESSAKPQERNIIHIKRKYNLEINLLYITEMTAPLISIKKKAPLSQLSLSSD